MRVYQRSSDSTDSIGELLVGARKIGWDFDETLIRHPASTAFWDYIASNPHQQEHFIITFRTSYLLDSIWFDLAREGSGLQSHHFEGVHGVPEPLYYGFVAGTELRSGYMNWKGKKCRNLGIQILIDDATDHVITGCSRYGINHFHPDEFI